MSGPASSMISMMRIGASGASVGDMWARRGDIAIGDGIADTKGPLEREVDLRRRVSTLRTDLRISSANRRILEMGEQRKMSAMPSILVTGKLSRSAAVEGGM